MKVNFFGRVKNHFPRTTKMKKLRFCFFEFLFLFHSFTFAQDTEEAIDCTKTIWGGPSGGYFHSFWPAIALKCMKIKHTVFIALFYIFNEYRVVVKKEKKTVQALSLVNKIEWNFTKTTNSRSANSQL